MGGVRFQDLRLTLLLFLKASCMGKVLDFFSSDGGGEVSRFTVDFAVVP